jgi:hypothetical protein
MTAEEKEIRNHERKELAKIRRIKIKRAKKFAAMTDDEYFEYYRKLRERLIAAGFNVASSLN